MTGYKSISVVCSLKKKNICECKKFMLLIYVLATRVYAITMVSTVDLLMRTLQMINTFNICVSFMHGIEYSW